MPEFIEAPRFPSCKAYGYTSDANYRTVKTRRASGFERRNRGWLYPLHTFTVTVGPRAVAEIAEVSELWHVAHDYYGFRMKDDTDYKSCRVHLEPTVNDGVLVETATAGVYQLFKQYTWGAFVQLRPIYKPVEGTITLSGGGSLDYTTGLVTGGSGGTWGGEFDVPVRFEPGFPVEAVNLQIESVSFVLEELRLNGSSG